MSVLLITYDYANTGAVVDPVFRIVREYKHVQLSQGAYAIETHEKTRSVFNQITANLKHDVHLMVITLSKPFSGSVLKPASVWLTKYLPEE
jgi:hypothetical protein